MMNTTKTPRTLRPHTTTIGSKFAATRDLSFAKIAKLVRADIKAAITAGSLPRAKYSVTTERYSMGRSMTIVISDLAPTFQIFNAKRLAHDLANPHASHVGLAWDVLALHTEQYDALRATLETLANEYNRVTTSNEPDDYSNVSFHLNVCIDSATREAARERETAACAPANDTAAPELSAQELFLTSIGAL